MGLAIAVAFAAAAWIFLFVPPRRGFWNRSWVVAIAAIAFSVAFLAIDDRLGSTLGPLTLTEVAIGALAGGLWLVATHVGHLVLCRLFPTFMSQVNDLYRIRAGDRPLTIAGPVVAIGAAEELLFRGVIQGETTLLVGVAVYTAVQVAERKWALIMAAAMGGLLWGALFEWRDGLVAPIVAHLLWTGVLALVWPLPGCDSEPAPEEQARMAGTHQRRLGSTG